MVAAPTATPTPPTAVPAPRRDAVAVAAAVDAADARADDDRPTPLLMLADATPVQVSLGLSGIDRDDFDQTVTMVARVLNDATDADRGYSDGKAPPSRR